MPKMSNNGHLADALPPPLDTVNIASLKTVAAGPVGADLSGDDYNECSVAAGISPDATERTQRRQVNFTEVG